MNRVTFIVDVCSNNVEAVITEDIADNLQAFAAAGIDVQFLCLPAQYRHIKQTLSETNASGTLVKVVMNHTPPTDSEISKVLLETRRQTHKYAFYCDLQTITDDDIIGILDSQFVGKLCEYVGDKLINFKADGIFFGGGVENLGGSEFTKKYNPRDKTKNNVKSLLKKIKTGK